MTSRTDRDTAPDARTPRATDPFRKGGVIAVLGFVSALISIFGYVSGRQTLRDTLDLLHLKWPKVTAPDGSSVKARLASSGDTVTTLPFSFDLPYDSSIVHEGKTLKCYSSLFPDQGGLVLCPLEFRQITYTEANLAFLAAIPDDTAAQARLNTAVPCYAVTLVLPNATSGRGDFWKQEVSLWPGEHTTVDMRLNLGSTVLRSGSTLTFFAQACDSESIRNPTGPILMTRKLIIQ